MPTKKLKRLIFTCATLPMLNGCGLTESNKSSPQLVNGVTAYDQPAIDIIYIKKTNGLFICTGTFLTHNIMLTAAHCLNNATKITVKGRALVSFFKNPNYIGEGRPDSPLNDQALLKFPDYTSNVTLKISPIPIKQGDRVTLYGAGGNDLESTNSFGIAQESPKSRSQIMRKGFAVFNGFDTSVIKILGSGKMSTNDGTSPSLGPGDSGGPMIVAGKGIVGIASETSLQDWQAKVNESRWSGLHSTYAINFFRMAKSKGFDVGYPFNTPF